MKILHLINSLNTGGAEKLIQDSIPLYVAKGIETDVLLLNGERHPFFVALEKQNCCKIICLGNGSVYNPLLIFKIIPYLKNYDLVHVHLFPAQYFVVIAKLLSLSKVKLIFTEHSSNNRRLENPIFKWLDQFVYQFYSQIICITPAIFNILKKHTKLADERFRIIENGVNLKAIKCAHLIEKKDIHPVLNDEDQLLIQVAGFREQKDQITLIKAITLMPESIKLLLVGEGILRKNNEKLVKKLKLENRVVFLGVRNDVPELLKSADIVVLSSKYEGLSLSSIEGMASGKPFIGSNVPGLKEVVEGAGLLFPQGDEKALAKIVVDLLNDKELYNKVSKACEERAAMYDINTMIEKHIALYQSIFND